LRRLRVIRLVLVAFGVTAALYVVVLFFLWRFQERVVFQPPSSGAPVTVNARQVRYRSDDGIDLFAYVVGDCAPETTIVLAFHGNAEFARWNVPWASEVVRRTGACVVMPEYRGYDGVAGTPTYPGSSLDARAAYAFIRDSLHATPARTVYFGHSLGTAIAAELAAEAAPRALLLQAPLSSAREMAARMFLPGLVLFWRVVSRVHFNTVARVASLGVPVWVAHGDNDFVIPVRMGREVFAAAKRKGELLIIHGAGHNDVPERGGAEYWAWLTHGIGSNVQSTLPVARAETRSEL
jgi:pimeloyl-ACP methyl ester carboxylesterase